MSNPVPGPLTLTALADVPAVQPGDDLAALLVAASQTANSGGSAHSPDSPGVTLRDGVLVVCQKIVSKAEGRLVELATVEPSPDAIRIAREDDKDPRHVEVVLRETVRIVRRGHRVMICETRHGFVCANAGVDLSNSPGDDIAVLLPDDADASARRLRDGLKALTGHHVAVVVSDTFGRPWREGLVDIAIGCAGMAPIDDIRGQTDWTGRELLVTTNATADQMAAAAGMLMVKNAGVPAVWISGQPPRGDGKLADILRDPSSDLFR